MQQFAKTAALSVTQQGIDTGASYLNNEVNATGGAIKHLRIVGRKLLITKFIWFCQWWRFISGLSCALKFGYYIDSL
jgi:hypothetical protein